MVRSFTRPQPARVVRFAASGLLLLQTAIATTFVSEFALTTPGTALTQSAAAQSRGNVQDAEAAVVHIRTNGRNGSSTGSGVIIDPSGLIVTNAHVVAGAREVIVTVQGREVRAEVVAMGAADCLDLALLQLPNQRNLPTLRLADASSITKTQDIWALGFPVGSTPTSPSIVEGTVNNIHVPQGVVVFNAPVNPGNSGGPVIDSQSRIIGITKSGARNAQNVNYAVSVEQVRLFVESYRQGLRFPIGQYVIPAAASSNQPISQSISLTRSNVQGNLQPADSRFCADGNPPTDIYTFEAEAGQAVMLRMSTRQAGSHLVLVGPDGRAIAFDRSNGANRDALVVQKLTQSGQYTVLAIAAGETQSGQYDLQISQPILVEQGMLDASTAPCFDDGSLCRAYNFQGRAGQTVALIVNSAFNPYLIVRDPNGDRVVEGRAERQGSLRFELPADGWYRLVVGGMEPGDRGEFFVSIIDTQDLPGANRVSQR
ncbi:S1C family serine protease [Thermoleptolyngbya sp. C42_A2020_037]|uniref:S1C family serine protease n=1 Tax=Thermoleptolyngbya sp. C42_A2020_037 TaxID=2747799 RepID=UPI001A0AEAD8|nr:S1C family serine protease [Thermoleptolyngbya sp. C42_A2020_037]MBF2086757.1 serine protease [Thermoleptolyngbya sp. C42_A2020_037]